MSRTQTFERQAQELLRRFDPASERKRLLDRPFMLELFGTPKSGKSTMREMIKHFFKRNGWSVSSPLEGAEAVELPRAEPQYNFQTAEYALSNARERFYNKRFHLVIFDRAIYDGVTRMELYRRKGIITAEQQALIEGYYLLPWNAGMFDMHICLVADVETAIKRELARALTKKHGETMNPQTLSDLLAAHQSMWDRLGCAANPAMCWHDSSKEREAETAKAILENLFAAFERRLQQSR
ncbi:MAG: hypothetical protein WCT10_01465 [Patescibacteria group bacterium]|jgi:hypothetical protein